MAERALFCYHFSERRCAILDSYDNEWVCLLMDDDLFPIDAEPQEGSERYRVG